MEKKSEVETEEVERALDEALETDEAEERVEVAAETMKGDLMQCVINMAKALPRSWQELSERQQDDYLESIDRQTQAAVERAIQILAAQNVTRINGMLEQVVFKDGCKASIKIPQFAEGLHELTDSTGKQVSILIVETEQFTSDKGKPVADPDQQAMELDDEDSIDDKGNDSLYQTAVEFVRQSNQTTITAVQRRLRIGYNRAARLLETMEKNDVVSAMGKDGGRELIIQDSEAAA